MAARWLALAAFAAAVIAVHAGLAGSGGWLGDEYFNFAMMRQQGFGFFLHRLVTWSPRPFSELEIYGYFGMVMAASRPLIGPFLLAFWAAALAASIAGWRRRGDGLMGVALPLSLFAMFLLGGRIDEMFYWPMGASPYLGGLAGVSFAALRLARGGGRAGVVIALVLAAGHTELGIMFSLCLCPLLLILDLRAPHGWRAALPWCVPLLYDGLALALLRFFRMAKPVDPSVLASPTYHQFWISLRAAMMPALLDLAGGSAQTVLSRLCLLAGLVVCIRFVAGLATGARLAAIATALLATIFLSIFAAYYQDGLACCGRHESFRQCLVMLLLAIVAALIAGLAPARRWLSPRVAPIGPALVAVAIALMLPGRAAGLAHDYAALAETARARAVTWRSAQAAGPEMTLVLPPGGRVVAPGALLLPGHYRLDDHPLWYVWGLLSFFGKSAVTVTNDPIR